MAKFLTSARTVDMLGRQQIAGIPTAISEIFKNAYDAYADSVRGDYFPQRSILSIRDDGIGMTREEFHARWLTIGTDSKARGEGLALPNRPPEKSPRRQMGEKGIGRLAIATVGPQLLLVSRSRYGDEYVVALVQWSLFEIPGLHLEDAVIPVRYVSQSSDLLPSLVEEMREEVREALHALGSRVPSALRRRIETELSALEVDVRPYLHAGAPDLTRGFGTMFLVSPVGPDVDATLQAESPRDGDLEITTFQRFLLGFANTMLHPEGQSPMSTEFVIHEGDTVRDIIDPDEFWGPSDFASTDHVIEGEFDRRGQFSGKVSIYGAEPVEHVEPWKNTERDSACGPFRIKFGYVQGELSGSRLTGEQFAIMTRRLESLGGLYIYRDGIRVLPYGNSDRDYLEIEQRRTLNAGRYYFSYRRMFGAIELDSDLNSGLQEKAGREGFRENQAYRDFTSILTNFLVQLAATFFSAKSPEGEDWATKRQGLRDRSAQRARREREAAERRTRFIAEVEERLASLESGDVARALSQLASEAERDIQRAVEMGSAGDVDSVERRVRESLEAVRKSHSLARPSTLALTPEQERTWDALVRRSEALELDLDKLAERIAAAIDRGEQELGDSSLDHPRRRAGRLKERRVSHLAALATSRDEIARGAQDLSEAFVADADLIISNFDRLADERLAAYAVLGPREEAEVQSDLARLALSAERDLTQLQERVRRAGDVELEDTLLSLQEEALDLREQVEQNLELLQLGQAVQVVSHEFEGTIKFLRRRLKDLVPWARNTPKLAPIVRDLRASFSHLDAYLRLFTPLQRRLYRQATEFSGADIFGFVSAVFSSRSNALAIEIQATPEFLAASLTGYPSTFYPVFVNLVDNALHWVSSVGTSGGRVLLDANSSGGLVVEDNGPGIRPRDRESVFERGFSRRPGGRGLGLSLAHDLLDADGWDLTLDTEYDSGARFIVSRQSEPEGFLDD